MYKKRSYDEENTPRLIHVLMAIIPILVLGGLLVYFAYIKVPKYQQSDTTYSSRQPAYDEYSQQWQSVQSREKQQRENVTAAYKQTSQYTQDQLQQLRTERELQKTQQKVIYPFK